MEVMDAPTAGSAHQVDAIEQRGEFEAPRRGAPSSVPGGGILAFKALGETQKATRALVQLLEAVKAACSMALGRDMAESDGKCLPCSIFGDCEGPFAAGPADTTDLGLPCEAFRICAYLCVLVFLQGEVFIARSSGRGTHHG